MFIQNFYLCNFISSTFVKQLFFHITNTIICQIPVSRQQFTFTYIWKQRSKVQVELTSTLSLFDVIILATHHPGGLTIA